jgi:N-glycosylase/DNA lyase
MAISLNDLREHYSKVKLLIEQRMNEFALAGKKGEKEIFRELCFCLLTAGASAELGIKTINHLGESIFEGDKSEIISKLKEIYRFYNVRGEYIFLAREKFDVKDLDLEHLQRRKVLIEKIKGLGYKESSHFLRNIGFKGYAILDKHVINLLYELGVIETNKAPKNEKEYLEIEGKMKSFSNEVGIDFDDLDLALWSYKTGEVLK